MSKRAAVAAAVREPDMDSNAAAAAGAHAAAAAAADEDPDEEVILRLGVDADGPHELIMWERVTRAELQFLEAYNPVIETVELADGHPAKGRFKDLLQKTVNSAYTRYILREHLTFSDYLRDYLVRTLGADRQARALRLVRMHAHAARTKTALARVERAEAELRAARLELLRAQDGLTAAARAP